MAQTAEAIQINETSLAALLDGAAAGGYEVDRVSIDNPIDLAAAYRIQKLNVGRRLDRGERLVGMKMGFTSVAKMRQMGVDESIWGRLTDRMKVENGGTVSFARFVHPRVEPEVAFLLKKPLVGVVSREEALDAVEAVAPAAEIIDSRYRNFKFTLVDVIADNSSSSAFALGAWCAPRDLKDLAVTLEVDGMAMQTGSTTAILGDPIESLIAAAKLAESGNDPLQAGWVVMAGAATEAVALQPGMKIRVSVESLGDVAFAVTQ